jgi:2-polyprenyl-3-methyl-5-hydroxy-6-metoxy-1,4-benzoquinol methylase
MNTDDLITEQINYYRDRAAEYDEWHMRQGRYFRGEEHRMQWFHELNIVRNSLATYKPFGTALELACGTGLWTGLLAEASTHLTAIDAVRETIEINRRKNNHVNIDYRVADIFQWQPEKVYDFIFFGFWLSHVPETMFNDFWNLLRKALRSSGTVFFVDSLETQESTATNHDALDNSGMVRRKLNDGRTYDIIKRFYDLADLKRNLLNLGWKSELKTTGTFFLYGTAQIQKPIALQLGSPDE